MGKRLKPIPNELITNRLSFENPWWETGRIEEEQHLLKRRLYFDLFQLLVAETEVKRAVVLMGPRRVGKTVLMHHSIDSLLRINKIRNDRICFINIENPLYLNVSLEELFLTALKTVGNEDTKGCYIFFDEIQYLKDWEMHLKVLVDSYPNTKFIVSGSAAAALKLKSNESGAGRFTEFLLPPLTFQEYIILKGYDNLIIESKMRWNGTKIPVQGTNNISALNRHFIDYINFGGYPEVIFSTKIQSDLSRYIKSDIIDKVLLRDLPSLYGIQNVQELNSFFTMLVYYTGSELSLDSLSSSSGINKTTLNKYIEYLEAAFLIKIVRRIDELGNKFTRNNFYKIYLTNPSLRSALFSPLQQMDNDMAHMVETAIFSQWMHTEDSVPFYYARWNAGEVDIVGLKLKEQTPLWAGEIKWSNKAFDNFGSIKNLISFCQKNNLASAIVTTFDIFDFKQIDGIDVTYIPCSLYAYNVGHNTISKQYQKMIEAL